jgi:hypothetical protein
MFKGAGSAPTGRENEAAEARVHALEQYDGRAEFVVVKMPSGSLYHFEAADLQGIDNIEWREGESFTERHQRIVREAQARHQADALDSPMAYAAQAQKDFTDAFKFAGERTPFRVWEPSTERYEYVTEHGERASTPSLRKAVVEQLLAIEKLECAHDGLEAISDELGEEGHEPFCRLLCDIQEEQTNALCLLEDEL